MKLPEQAVPITRQKWAVLWRGINLSGLSPSRAKCITGVAVCKRRGSVLFTGDATICGEVTHDNCTAAKNQAAADIMAACQDEGGTVSHSAAPCSVGDNCRTAADCE